MFFLYERLQDADSEFGSDQLEEAIIAFRQMVESGEDYVCLEYARDD